MEVQVRDASESFAGVWVGSLTIRNAAQFRLGITVPEDADGTLGAAPGSMDGTV